MYEDTEKLEAEAYSHYDDILEAKKEKRKRKRERKRLFRKVFLFVAIAVIVLSAGLLVFANSDYFTVNSIKVTGNEYYTNAQIKKICGVKKNVNIWKIKKASMEALLLDDPYIESADISRDLPGTIVISVQERIEYGALYSKKNYYTIDGNGYVLSISGDQPKDIPVIKGITVKKAKEGEPVEVKQSKALNSVLTMLKASMKSTLSYRSIKVKNQVCYAYIKKKLYVKGLPEDITEAVKSGKLEAVIYDLYSKDIKNGKIVVGSDEYCVFSP